MCAYDFFKLYVNLTVPTSGIYRVKGDFIRL